MRKITKAIIATAGISTAVMCLMKSKSFVTNSDTSDKKEFYSQLKELLAVKEAEFEKKLNEAKKAFELEKEASEKEKLRDEVKIREESLVYSNKLRAEYEAKLREEAEKLAEISKNASQAAAKSAEYEAALNAANEREVNLRNEYEEKLRAAEESFGRELNSQEEKLRELEMQFEQAKRQNVHIADIPQPQVDSEFEDVMDMVNNNSQNVVAEDPVEEKNISIEEIVVNTDNNTPENEGEWKEAPDTHEEETTSLTSADKEKIEQANKLFKKTGDIKVFLHHKGSQGERFNFIVRFDHINSEDVNVLFLNSKGEEQKAALKVYDNSVYFSLAGNETMIIKDIPENTIFTVTQVKNGEFITKSTRMTSNDLAKAVRKIGNDVYEDEKQDAVVEYFEKTRKLIERNEIANATVKNDEDLETYLFVNKRPGEEIDKLSLKERFSKMFS